jgi:F-type H+-transporting ATPase subunit delta
MAAKDLMGAAVAFYCLSFVRVSTTFVSVAPETSARPWVVTSGPAGKAPESVLQLGLRSVAAALAVGAAASRLAALRPHGGRGQSKARVVECRSVWAGIVLGDPKDRPDVPNFMYKNTGATAPTNPVISYCEALASIAEKTGEQLLVAQDVMKLNDLYNDELFIAKFEDKMNDWFAPDEGIAQLIVELLKPQSKTLPKFLEMVAKRGRAETIQEIIRGYIELNYTVAKVQLVRCVSADPLSEDQKKKLIAKMKERTGCEAIKLITEVDSSLGAGLNLQWDYLDTETPAQPQSKLTMSLSSKIKSMAAGQGVLLVGTEAVSLAEDLSLV